MRKKIISRIVKKTGDGHLHEVGISNPVDIFALNVFSQKARKDKLSAKVFQKLEKTIANKDTLDANISDEVASAMKEWAIEQGATHYTHWFQPLRGTAAEKHDSFFELQGNDLPIMRFSGTSLTKGEPDASSFPSGGLRSTFEARGYTAWDPVSPAFIKSTQHGATLCIPTVFISYNGEALDLKTPLLKSQSVLSKSAVRILKMIGTKTHKVITTAGLEQEFFLIDRHFYYQRPDLVATNRTLFGLPPYRGQELEDHYFGNIKKRALLFYQTLEKELYKLGLPVKTRHNEVAPCQYELALIYEDANLAVDHNVLLMEIIDEIAQEFNLKVLLHEKPFAFLNGSGKHCNWSMMDAKGNNLLEPGKTPHENMQFLIFLSCTIRAIDKYAKLLRLSVGSAGNDHRLGASEAPPAIMSIFLGSELADLVEKIVSGETPIVYKETSIELGLLSLPSISKDNTDRNRTSPFAFTGNKFEFRAVGSALNPASPNFILNTAMTESLDYFSDVLAAEIEKGKKMEPAIHSVVKMIFTKHKRVIFNGDGYSDEWQKEALKRKLPNIKNSFDSFLEYTSKESIALFEKYEVLNKNEIQSRQNTRMHKYITTIDIEVKASLDIVDTIILPSALKYQKLLAENLRYLESFVEKETMLQSKLLLEINRLIEALLQKKEELKNLQEKKKYLDTMIEEGQFTYTKIIPTMEQLRKIVDTLEGKVDDELWSLPKFREILFIY